ncbi:VOC family protein [Marinicella sp. S1101]|uniref:VOC family protein n=1 Tax=Marinicella marina TaxID=2996016 RepID=UPI0022608191|nr:VOC family protein [Marinicella marina]MCX7552262.1 VOC family protein [Marinicella marina]MDJ1139138.1 VOC family protein [Marinicella marina]
MNNPFQASIGVVMSADIAVPKHAQMKQFYAAILTTGDKAFWQSDLMNSLGIPIIGLGKQSPEYGELPLQWMPHMQVADVGHSVTQALALGGRELVHGKDEAGRSQWAVMEDPNGAAFGLIPLVADAMLPKLDDKSDAELAHMGNIAWLDLTVTDATKTRDFYCAVVGWQAEEVAMKDAGNAYADYNMLNSNGQPAAGICHAKGVNAELPEVWLMYLPVGDLADSLKQVVSLGGQVLNQSNNNKNQPTQALIKDPNGVSLVLVQG